MTSLETTRVIGAEGPDEDKRHPIRGQMLAATNFYHTSRLSAADTKATSLMAIAGVGLGFLAQRTSLQASTLTEAVEQVVRHPSLIVLFGVIVLAVIAQRAVRVEGPDWLSHMVAGAPAEEVADEFLEQNPRELFRSWIASQTILARIADRKYKLVNAATWLLMAGFGLAILGA